MKYAYHEICISLFQNTLLNFRFTKHFLSRIYFTSYMRSLKKDRVLLLICENTATSTLQGIKLSPSLSRPSWSSRPIPFVHYRSIVLMTKRRWGPNPSYKWPSLLNWCEIRNIIRSRNCALRTQESYSLFLIVYGI